MSTPELRALQTGLPVGVTAGHLGKRVAAVVVDSLIPFGITAIVVGLVGTSGQTVAVVAGSALVVGWGLLVLGLLSVGTATPGMRLLDLQLVGLDDGRPVGWRRALIRAVIFFALSLSVVGLVLMLIFLVLQPRRQGWHDLAVRAVLIKRRPLAPPSDTTSSPAHPAPRSGPQPSPHPTSDLESATDSTQQSGGSDEDTPPPDASAETVTEAAARYVWVATLDDGREIEIVGVVLVGRNPQPRAEDEAPTLVKVPDPTRKVSKSHLALDVDGEGAYLLDCGSVNGSRVTDDDGRFVSCPAGEVVRLQDGTRVAFGDRTLTIGWQQTSG